MVKEGKCLCRAAGTCLLSCGWRLRILCDGVRVRKEYGAFLRRKFSEVCGNFTCFQGAAFYVFSSVQVDSASARQDEAEQKELSYLLNSQDIGDPYSGKGSDAAEL
jgi:hypothetical protein